MPVMIESLARDPDDPNARELEHRFQTLDIPVDWLLDDGPGVERDDFAGGNRRMTQPADYERAIQEVTDVLHTRECYLSGCGEPIQDTRTIYYCTLNKRPSAEAVVERLTKIGLLQIDAPEDGA